MSDFVDRWYRVTSIGSGGMVSLLRSNEKDATHSLISKANFEKLIMSYISDQTEEGPPIKMNNLVDPAQKRLPEMKCYFKESSED